MDSAAGPSWAASWMEAGAAADLAVRAGHRGHRGAIRGRRIRGAAGLPARWTRCCTSAARCRSATSTRSWRAATPGSGASPTGASTASMAWSRRRSGRPRRSVGPVLLVVGDVSFVHDLNALVASRLHDLSATIVVIDNDGGGIFSFLPQGTAERPDIGLPEHYEELFGTPHGVDVLAVARILGAETAELEPGADRRGRGRFARSTGRARAAPAHRPCPQRGAPSTGPGRRGGGARVMRLTLDDGVGYAVRVDGSRAAPAAAPRVHGQQRHLDAAPARAWPPAPDDRGRPAGTRRLGCATRRADMRWSTRPPTWPRSSIGWLTQLLPTSLATPSAPASACVSPSTRPAAVRRLVLESPSAGIVDAAERVGAPGGGPCAGWTQLERGDMDGFVRDWAAQPVFASQAVLAPGVRARAGGTARQRTGPMGSRPACWARVRAS